MSVLANSYNNYDLYGFWVSMYLTTETIFLTIILNCNSRNVHKRKCVKKGNDTDTKILIKISLSSTNSLNLLDSNLYVYFSTGK